MKRINKGTSGPWVYAYGAVYQEQGLYQNNANRLLLADRDNDRTAPTERDANCKLAALAPEMAEALKRLVGDVDLGEVDYEAPERESLEYARAVLAKLEGES